MSFDGLLGLYLDALRAERWAKSQVGAAAQGLGRFFAHLENAGIRDVKRVREADVVSFVRALSEEVSPSVSEPPNAAS